MEELLRTNDLVLISAVEAILAQAGLRIFVADAHASVMDGSLGFLPRRVMVAGHAASAARALLIEAGLEGELRPAALRPDARA
ncbi:MAG: DUF2007 domain-containing protein [Rhodoblastus sp.]|nr:MAG: DUF2007 domain-containing protein [Rhodoblastus sp.]